MNKNTKKYVQRGLAGAMSLALLTGGVMASTNTTTLTAAYTNIKLLIHGQPASMGTDSKGNDVEPFVVDGVSYIPVRSMAEALGEDIDWDGTTNTISIGNAEAPKYVFLFIGDGLSHVQTQMANYYLDAMEYDTLTPQLEAGENILQSKQRLSYMAFDTAGITTTYDSTSFAPDSASTATSIATGQKTHSGIIGMNETFTESYVPMSTKMQEQLGYKVGVITSVTLNHATPAAFYASNESRNNYYEIGLDLVDSGFDYFAGGEISKHDNDGESTSVYDLAEDAGYTVILKDQASAEAFTADDGKVIIIGEDTSGALPYEMDREESMWALADYVEKGIEVLDNDTGFFMMVEGGKIDWACHAQDAAAAINEVIAFDNAVQEAVEFYNQHPDETLIVVTGDHETGGMTIGYAGTEYDTFLDQLSKQKNSYDKFDDLVDGYRENNTSLNDVMVDVKSFFGLATSGVADNMTLTDYEMSKITASYNASMALAAEAELEDDEEFNLYEAVGMYEDQCYEAYGSYEPLTVTLLSILNNKSGVDFTSYSHTGVTVGTYAHGYYSDYFDGFYDNTDIYNNIATIMNLK